MWALVTVAVLLECLTRRLCAGCEHQRHQVQSVFAMTLDGRDRPRAQGVFSRHFRRPQQPVRVLSPSLTLLRGARLCLGSVVCMKGAYIDVFCFVLGLSDLRRVDRSPFPDPAMAPLYTEGRPSAHRPPSSRRRLAPQVLIFPH